MTENAEPTKVDQVPDPGPLPGHLPMAPQPVCVMCKNTEVEPHEAVPTAQGTFQCQTQVRQCGDLRFTLRSHSAQIPTRTGKEVHVTGVLVLLPSLSPLAKGSRRPEDSDVGEGRHSQLPHPATALPLGAHM